MSWLSAHFRFGQSYFESKTRRGGGFQKIVARTGHFSNRFLDDLSLLAQLND
jgi:hypothetical protein